MKSAIDELLTDGERAYFDSMENGDAGRRRTIRMSIQYAIGAGIFVYIAIAYNNPYWSLVVYGTFVFWLFIRVLRASIYFRNMRGLISKYEQRIRELEQLQSPANPAS
jgi:hypothetical protein